MSPAEKNRIFKSGELIFSVEGESPETYAVRRCYLTLPAVRGRRCVHFFRGCNPQVAAWLANRPEIAQARWSSTLFLDVETTGLTRDADNLVFLVGAAYLSTDPAGQKRLSIRQYFARNTLEIGPILLTLFRKFPRPTLIVTFSGSSFDLSLLKVHALHRELPWPWEDVPELDLGRCAQRMWKQLLGTWKMRTLEKEILGYRRRVDLTAPEIPERWFEYQANRNPDILEAVFWHNIEDLLTLPTLLSAMLEDLAHPKHLGIPEKLALARYAIEIGDDHRAQIILRKVIREADNPADRLAALKMQHRLLLRGGDQEKLNEFVEAMRREFPHLRHRGK